jgi:CheY-specific phosphatase CheX
LVVATVVSRTENYLKDEFGLAIERMSVIRTSTANPKLREVTAIIGLGGYVNMLVGLSLDRRILRAIFVKMTEGIVIPDEDEQLYQREAAGDFVNTIVGNCTLDFQQKDKAITLTPPIILEGQKRIALPKNAVYYGVCLETDGGEMDVDFFGPPEVLQEWSTAR